MGDMPASQQSHAGISKMVDRMIENLEMEYLTEAERELLEQIKK